MPTTGRTGPDHRGYDGADQHEYSEGWAWVSVNGEFFPDLIEARPGERLRIVFRREETSPCSERVVIPSLGRVVTLPPFEEVSVDLGPLNAGLHPFGCGLGVLRGVIVVGDPAANELVVTPDIGPAARPDSLPTICSYGLSESSDRKGGHKMTRPTVNITPTERLARIGAGLAAVIAGLILLGSASGAAIVILEILLVAAGLDLIGTGALGHCPLYRKLGYTPPSLRRHA